METPSKKPNPIDVEVGRRIRMRRTLLGLSQTTLADALGITFQQVQKYEKGTNRVGASRLQAIAEFLQIPVSFLFEGQETIGADAESLHGREITEFISTTEGLSLNRSFVRIQDPDVRRKVVGLVKVLASTEADQDAFEGLDIQPA
nr:helix-turn-helix transcriptional regulator [Pararhizobium polonicum]